MKHLNTFLSLLLLALFFSCSDETVVVPGNELKPQVDAIVSESAQIKKAVNDKNLLKYATQEDKNIFKRSLQKIEAALLKLSYDKYNRNALTVLYQGFKEIERMQILKTDNAVLEPFFAEIGAQLNRVAAIQGVQFDDLTWAIFAHNFSDGIAPFASFGSGKEWETGWSRDRGYVTVGGYGNIATLVSPTFDLTSINNPKFRIRHSISINQNTKSGGDFDRNKILNGVFKAYVSTDYINGDPTNLGKGTWQEISLSPLPRGIDFHTIQSPQIDLSDFVGETVTVKLVFDMQNTSEFGKHYVSWYVEEIEILGSGEALVYTDRPKDLYFHEFKTADFKPFNVLNMIRDGATWQPFGFSEGFVDLAKIQTNGMPSEAWMLSPRISLKGGEDLFLKISEEAKTPVWEKFKIFISTDYRGGNPAESTWKQIKRTVINEPNTSGWIKNTHAIDLTEYKDKTIVVGFQYIADSADYNIWELKSVSVRGLGEGLRYYSYDITYVPFEELPPVVDTGSEPFETYDFVRATDSGPEANPFFTQAVIAGDAAEWQSKNYNENYYLRISGYPKKQEGTRLLYSGEIDLAGKKSVEMEIKHAINYYKPDAQAMNLLQVVVAEAGDDIMASNWTEITFPVVMPGNSFDIKDSGYAVIPEALQGKKIVVGFIYKGVAEKNFYPNWDLYELKLREGEE